MSLTAKEKIVSKLKAKLDEAQQQLNEEREKNFRKNILFIINYYRKNPDRFDKLLMNLNSEEKERLKSVIGSDFDFK